MDEFVGEIRMFGGTFAPVNWQFCDGRLLPIAVYADLYALIGTIYGGDGVISFALPNLCGRIPVGASVDLPLGGKEGMEQVTLNYTEIPAHTHGLVAASNALGSNPEGNLPAPLPSDGYGTGGAVSTSPSRPAGNSHPHENIAPSLVLNFIICIRGERPQLDIP